MKSTIALALFALASSVQSGVLPRTNPCYTCQGFTITVSGGVNGPLGQIGDGQLRVGPATPNHAKFSLGCDGGIYDANGRGCILTQSNHGQQFQCDQGAHPTKGASIGNDGRINYNGNSQFWACPVDDHGNWNVYKTPVPNQSKCTKVWLSANGCGKPTPPPTKPPTPPSTCPYSNVYPNGQWFEFPHLIIPVDSSKPNTAPGTSYFGTITPKVSSLFNFDVHPKYAGKKCSLVFLFPPNPPSDTSSYTFSGSGNLRFTKKSQPATEGTTWNNQPGTSQDYGITKVVPGNSYTIATFNCPAGDRIGFGISSTDTNLRFFQDYNPRAVGLYISVC